MQVHTHFATMLALMLLLVSGAAAQLPVPKPSPEKPETDPLIAKLTKADPKDDPLRKLQKERLAVAAEVVRQLLPRLGTVQAEDFAGQVANLFSATKRLLDSGMDLADTPEDKFALLKQHVANAKAFEKMMISRGQAGTGAPHLALEATAKRIDAEVMLLKFEKELEKAVATVEMPLPSHRPGLRRLFHPFQSR